MIYIQSTKSLVAQTVQHLFAVQEIWVQSLSWKDPYEKGMTTNSSILAWRISGTKEPGGETKGYSPRGY